MITRRLAAALCVLTLPLVAIACSTEEDALAEPELRQEATTPTEEEQEETTTERSSTTVSTVYETETVEEDNGAAKKNEPAAAESGGSKGPCKWTPAEQGSVGDKVYSYCDGRFAEVGVYGTDATGYYRWDGNDWAKIDHAGQTYTGFRCYDEAHLDDLGVPATLKEQMILCD